MFAKANKDYEANMKARGNSLAKQLFPPSSSPSAPNTDIRDQLKKPNNAFASARNPQFLSSRLGGQSSNANPSTANPTPANTNRGSLAMLYGSSKSSFKQESNVVDLTESEPQAKIHEAVYFAEDDFSDDENLDLDFEAPSALPVLPSAAAAKPVSFDSMPPPTSTQSDAKIPWSSSPLSHFQHPNRALSELRAPSTGSLKREPTIHEESLDPPAQKRAKRRVLPPSFRYEDPEEDFEDDGQVTKTPARKPKGPMWDPTASAVKERKAKLKNQRQQNEPAQNNDYSTSEIENIVKKSKAKTNFAVSLSDEQKQVLDLVSNQNKSVFFTGPAGTGKSVLMRAIITELLKKYAKDPERVAVTASTGLAACNIGGITLHSFSGIGLGKEDAPTLVKKIRRNPKAKNRWLRTRCLIIDEISMVDGELFDKLDKIGRTIRNNGRPWGGIQLIITGDFFQLPPVPESGAKRETKFAFDAATWNTSIDHTIGLTQVFRQRDPQFANMLNEMRLGRISEDTVRAFKALSRPLEFDDGPGTAELFSTRAEVEGSNEKRLRDLPGTVRRYEAMDSGPEATREKLLGNMMAPKAIDLKVGAQVMLIKNLDETLVNGSLGKVIAFADEKTYDMSNGEGYGSDEDPMAKAKRKLAGFSRDGTGSGGTGVKFPVVEFISTHETARTILCVPEDWKVELPNGEVQAKRTQLPLILAWALSIHKAQGQTLERVKVNLGRVFEKGQAYVALSRATTQAGLQVLGFDKGKVMAHPRVVNFYNKLYSAGEAHGKKPASVSDLLKNRIGASAQPKKKTSAVVDLDDDEDALHSYGL